MKGVLLVNLGSPDSPTPKDVKPYLDEFLMDERVIDVPKWLRNVLVRGIILQTRPKKSAKAYAKIWWDEGSPLIIISERFAEKVQQKIDMPVALGMRYGTMSIRKALKQLEEKGVDEVFLVPLYPHYAMSSYETVVVKTMEVQQKHFPNMQVTTMPAFYSNSEYIKVLAESIAEPRSWERVGKVAKLLLEGTPRALTGGATHYHTKAVNPSWAQRFPRTAAIGSHYFYRQPIRSASK